MSLCVGIPKGNLSEREERERENFENRLSNTDAGSEREKDFDTRKGERK
jgi:hypothetical protein